MLVVQTTPARLTVREELRRRRRPVTFGETGRGCHQVEEHAILDRRPASL
jgi:hypothetical protein